MRFQGAHQNRSGDLEDGGMASKKNEKSCLELYDVLKKETVAEVALAKIKYIPRIGERTGLSISAADGRLWPQRCSRAKGIHSDRLMASPIAER